jgi:hypothetical protein
VGKEARQLWVLSGDSLLRPGAGPAHQVPREHARGSFTGTSAASQPHPVSPDSYFIRSYRSTMDISRRVVAMSRRREPRGGGGGTRSRSRQLVSSFGCIFADRLFPWLHLGSLAACPGRVITLPGTYRIYLLHPTHGRTLYGGYSNFPITHPDHLPCWPAAN